MEDPVRLDILKLFRANPLLRDTPADLAMRLGRTAEHVQKILKDLEAEGLVAVRWVGGSPIHFFTGTPEAAREAPAGARAAPKSLVKPAVLNGRLEAPATMEGVSMARSSVEALCRVGGMDRSCLMEFTIAVSEALTNAQRYGCRGDGKDKILVELKLTQDQVELKVKDRGSGFPSLLVGTHQGDVQSTGGRGLMLMRSLTDSMEITRSRSGAVVTLVKRLQPLAAGE